MWFSTELVLLPPQLPSGHRWLAPGPDHTADEVHTGSDSWHRRAWVQLYPGHGAIEHHWGSCRPTLPWALGISPSRTEGIQEHTMPMSRQLHTTQIGGLPGEPGASAQNMPPPVGRREMPGEGVRERGLEPQGRAAERQAGRPGEEEPRRGKGLEGSQP